MGIRVLGPLRVDGSPDLGRRDRVVLAALATSPGRPVSADRLADALWRDRPPASAAKILQGCVVRIRKVLGREAVQTSSHGYALHLAIEDVDSLRFIDQVNRAGELLALGEADRAAYLLTDALELWHGEAFADLESWEPALEASSRLAEMRRGAEELRMDALLRAGRCREALSETQALVHAAPLRERRWVLLARAQYQSGQQGEALRTVRQLREVLARHLGVDPGPEVVAIETAILRQDESLLVADAPVPSATCPWMGLRPYAVEDADWFFGRDHDVAACLDILARTPVLALVGPSGSGKSSLLRAGVATALRRRGLPSVTITPGARPMESLTTLADAPHGAALLVDQCEELFTRCDDPGEPREFLRALVAESQNRTVVVVLRADHLAEVAGHVGFSRLVERGMFLVGGLGEDGLRTAIETPARQAGLLIEPGLVDLLVREVGNDPGALPLLSHALLETWKRREGNTLTVAGYLSSGGINGAVAQSAEGLYSRVPVDQRLLLRDLVLRLVSPGAEGEPVRTRVPRRLVGTDNEHDQLIEMLVAARLVTSDDGALEITHEALTRAWPRLRGWLDDDVEGQRIRHHLSAAADSWDALGRPESELYRGVRLARALDWSSRERTTLTEVESVFLEASSRLAEAEERSMAAQARAQARMIRRLRSALAGAAALLVVALVSVGVASVQSDRASENAARAEKAAVAADARRVGTRAQLTDDVSLSLLLAAAGARLDDSSETRANLMTALATNPELVRSAPAEGGYVEALDVSRDGQLLLTTDDQNRVHLYDAATSRLLNSYHFTRPSGDGWLLATFSPDSRMIAVIPNNQASTEPVRLLDTDTMRPATRLAFPGGEPVWGWGVRFSADGRHLAAAVHTVDWYADPETTAPAYVLVWDLRHPSTPPVRVHTGTIPQGVALSPDGRTVYTDWPLTAYDVSSGEQIWQRPHLKSLPSVDVSSDGTLLALADSESVNARERSERSHTTVLVRASDGATVRALRGLRDQVRSVRFSPDGSLVGSHAWDGGVSVWRVATGRQLSQWDTPAQWGVGFGPDDDLVYDGGGPSMLRTWDRSMADTYLRQAARVAGVDVFTHADLSPDGRRVAYHWVDGADRGWIRFLDTTTGEATAPARVPASPGPQASGTWHPQGRSYATTCVTGECAEVVVLDPATGGVVGRQDVRGGIVSVAYADSGRSLLVGLASGQTLVVDARTLQTLRSLDVPAASLTTIGDGSTAMADGGSPDGTAANWRVFDVNSGQVLSQGTVNVRAYAFAVPPGGSTVAMASDGGEVATVDVATGAERRSISLGAAVLSLDYSDDGELLVSGADDGGVSLWDARTLDLLGTVYPPHEGDPVPTGAEFIGGTHDVAIASYDGRVYRWETALDRALDFACMRAGRDLSEKEWEQYLPAQPYQSVCPSA